MSKHGSTEEGRVGRISVCMLPSVVQRAPDTDTDMVDSSFPHGNFSGLNNGITADGIVAVAHVTVGVAIVS